MKKLRKNTALGKSVDQPSEWNQELLQTELRLAREKAENVARLYTDLYVEIYNFLPAGFISLDSDGKICELNVCAATMLSRERTALINQYFNQCIAVESRQAFNSFFRRVYSKRGRTSCEIIVNKPDGALIYLHLEGVISEVEQKCLIAAVDITEQKLMEAELRESESNFRNLFENLPIGVSMTGIDRTMRVNNALCRLFGYSRVELAGKKWDEITHPDDIQKTADVIQSLIEGRVTQVKFEKRFIHKDGSTIFAELTSYLQRDKSGKPQYLLTAIIDLTAGKKH